MVRTGAIRWLLAGSVALTMAGMATAQDSRPVLPMDARMTTAAEEPAPAATPAANGKAADRAGFVRSLFQGGEQFENFNRIDQLFRTDTIPASTRPDPLAAGPAREIPTAFEFQGQQRSTEAFLADTDTSALLVLKDGKVVFERYWLTGGPEVRWLSMSVAKSMVSALVGAAVADRRIASVNDPISNYLPDLAGSAYEGVAIRDVLHMASGARWREDYSDGESDVFRLGQLLATGGSVAEFVRTLPREMAPGTFRYNSADTQVLGLLVEKVTGKRLAPYTNEKLWQPVGATSPAFWLTDDGGTAHAYAGFNATARDYARLGELYRNGGRWQGRQVVAADWVRASLTPAKPRATPGAMGYGYQWWLPGDGDPGDFSAIGVYNQFVYVSPKNRTVVVKLSANTRYGQTNGEESDRESETFALFRAIGRAM